MAKSPVLFKRSDGFCEANDGSFAVMMLAHDPGQNALTYAPSLQADPIRIEWSEELSVPIVLLPFEVASGLATLGYARHLTVEEVAHIVESGGVIEAASKPEQEPDKEPEQAESASDLPEEGATPSPEGDSAGKEKTAPQEPAEKATKPDKKSETKKTPPPPPAEK